MKIGIVLVKPWNDGPWSWPRFVSYAAEETNWQYRKVALSFNRAALVFDLNWYINWMRPLGAPLPEGSVRYAAMDTK